ncbi:hypothetical protein SISNIDRAFT_460613 [Sistotremastrum niveocremeum HHB9708]|uniref:Uncharacterized protein n=1 Tax=Sistotremastrum niveocremeum HHB9708 TaxID=1314777 RepID=A0A164NGF2_9AGAM|nr:hypothetical protein SISNIDRAFT_460613 [Sistotremastrum niveocremeum HHB9708]
MSDTQSLTQWLEEGIRSLLTAGPQIGHFPRHAGHGPVDIFSSRFNALFATNVTALVNGQLLDNAALKQKLSDVQKAFSPETAQFSSSVENVDKPGFGQVGLFFLWKPQNKNEHVQVSLNAVIETTEDDGIMGITSLTLVSGSPVFNI